MKEIFSKRAQFLCSLAAFKSSLLQLLMVMRFDYDIVLVLGFFDRDRRFQVVNLIFNANLEVFDQFC